MCTGSDPSATAFWLRRYSYNSLFAGWFKYRWMAEEAVRSSGAKYSIIRLPEMLSGFPHLRPLEVSQTDGPGDVMF